MNQLSRISRDLFSDLFKDLSLQRQISKPFYDLSLPESINIDIRETAEAFSVQADIPGVKKEDISVTIENRQLQISVEAKQEKEEKKEEKVIMSERYFGFVSRSVTLPGDVDTSKVEARYENGVLFLTLPKTSTKASNRIAIH
jgi:HSP20 family protein